MPPIDNLHPTVFDMLRGMTLKSSTYPNHVLLYCGLNMYGEALLAGVKSQALIPVSLDTLSVAGATRDIPFREIYDLLKQIHPDTPVPSTKPRIPPKLSSEALEAQAAANQRAEKPERIYWQEMDAWRANPVGPQPSAAYPRKGQTEQERDEARPPMTEEEAWHGLTGE